MSNFLFGELRMEDMKRYDAQPIQHEKRKSNIVENEVSKKRSFSKCLENMK